MFHELLQQRYNTAAVCKTSALWLLSSFQSQNVYFNSETSSLGVGGGARRQASEVGDQGGGGASCSGHPGEPARLWGGVHGGHRPYPHHHHQHHTCPGRYVQTLLLHAPSSTLHLS